MEKRGPVFVKNAMQKLNRLLGCKNSERAKKKIAELMEQSGLCTRLSDLGIKNKDINFIADNVNEERLGNNPVLLNREILLQILTNIF